MLLTNTSKLSRIYHLTTCKILNLVLKWISRILDNINFGPPFSTNEITLFLNSRITNSMFSRISNQIFFNCSTTHIHIQNQYSFKPKNYIFFYSSFLLLIYIKLGHHYLWKITPLNGQSLFNSQTHSTTYQTNLKPS